MFSSSSSSAASSTTSSAASSTTSSAASSNTNSQNASVDASWKGWGAKVKFHGAVSNKNTSQRSSDTSAKYTVNVTAKDDGAPEGLMKVLDILGEAIQPLDGGGSGGGTAGGTSGGTGGTTTP